MLVFQGRQDESVDPTMVERWAPSGRTSTLRLVDDGHQLTASMDGSGRTEISGTASPSSK